MMRTIQNFLLGGKDHSKHGIEVELNAYVFFFNKSRSTLTFTKYSINVKMTIYEKLLGPPRQQSS